MKKTADWRSFFVQKRSVFSFNQLPFWTTAGFLSPFSLNLLSSAKQPIMKMSFKTSIALATAIVSAILLLNPSKTYSQEKNKDKQIFTIVENMPAYEGCESLALEEEKRDCTTKKVMEFLSENVNYPAEAKDAGIEGIVYLSYIVGEDGEVEDVQVLRGVPNGGMLTEEAVRVLQKLPRFTAGTQRGKEVAVRYNIPVRFALTDQESEK